MEMNSESTSVNFSLDPFDELGLDEDDDILAQAYDDSISRLDKNGTGTNPGPSFLKSKNPQSSNYQQSGSNIGFDFEAGKKWIYPVNYPIRDYQFAIVEQALYKNTLVSLPTGLGKTFIAAVVMYNFYRWYPRCKVVFMAPTKPLVAQQVEACFNVVGIPQEDISQMTGSMSPEARIQEWKEKRIFFLTPQVLTNDFARGACPAEMIKCLVLDEAHRATGNHAYCQVIRELRERRCEFRVLALSATPGSDMVAVIKVLTNLLISHIELRSEDSPDIQQYTHQRNIEKVVVPLGEELTNIKNKFQTVLRVYVNRLIESKVLFTRDETTLSKFQLLQARDAFRQCPPGSLPRHRFGAVEGLFALCVTLYHAFDLMLLHGARSSFKFLKGILEGDKTKSFARSELLRNAAFNSLMEDLSKKFELHENQSMNSSSAFPSTSKTSPRKTTKDSYMISHPKMPRLCELVVNHHQKFADEANSTRIMIFSQYRESVLEITEMLQLYEPLVKAMSFVGQGSINNGSRGISQKEQLRVVKQFKEGGFNTLVSTCVGEEGLDIGDVDLIICYDAPKSPIRLVQRMGRTGRKREGRIVVLITKGKEEQMYNASQYKKKAINSALEKKDKLNQHLYTQCPKMIPSGINPICLKLHMQVEKWVVHSKKGRKKTSSSNPTVKFPSRKNASPKGKHGFLSEEEWNWYKDNLWVPREEVKTICNPSLQCLRNEGEDGNFVDLGTYQPWYNSLQQTHHIGHSSRSEHLVQLSEFINLQVTIGADEDPYGLEMAAFLDMSYVTEDMQKQQQPQPISRTSESQESKKENKKSKKSKADKNKIVKNNALITSMFQKISSSAPQNMQNSSQISKGAINCEGKVFKGMEINVDNHQEDNVRDEVMVIDDDFVHPNDEELPDLGKELFQQVSSPKSQTSNHLDTIPSKAIDNFIASPIKENRVVNLDVNTQSDDIDVSFKVTQLPLCGRRSPLQIHSPPTIKEFVDGEVLDEPNSPSKVVAVIDNWVDVKCRTFLNDDCLNEIISICLLRKKKMLPSIRMEAQLHDEDDELPDLNISKKTALNTNYSKAPKLSVDSEPIKRVVYAEDSDIGNNVTETIIKGSSNAELVMTPEKYDDETTNTDVHEVSPILSSTYRRPLRTNLICSSTPKVNAKRLFKIATPDVTTIEKNSMLQSEETITPNKREGIKGIDKTSSISVKDKIRLKLNRFSYIEKESDSGMESEVLDDAVFVDEKEPAKAKDEAGKFELYHIDAPDAGSSSIDNYITKDDTNEETKFLRRLSQRTLDFNDSRTLKTSVNTQILENADVKHNYKVDKENEEQNLESNIIDNETKENEGKNEVSTITEAARSIKNGFPANSFTSFSSHSSKRSSTSQENQKFLNLNKDIVHSTFSKVNATGTNTQENLLAKSTLDTVNFDLSLDEDIFADIGLDMNAFDKSKKNVVNDFNEEQILVEKQRNIDGKFSEGFDGPNNVSQPITQKLLSATQIIDLVDESANETRYNKSFKTGNSSRMSKLSKSSPLPKKRLVPDQRKQDSGKEAKLPKGIDFVDSKNDFASSPKKPLLLSRKPSSEKLDTEACPNFSLMDGIDFDDDFETDNDNPSIPNFDLVGTGEFQPVVIDCDKCEFSEQSENSKKKDLSKNCTSSGTEEKTSSKSSFLHTFSELGANNVERTPNKSPSGCDSSLISPRTVRKVMSVKSPESFCASQDTANAWKRRERKPYNVICSDSESSINTLKRTPNRSPYGFEGALKSPHSIRKLVTIKSPDSPCASQDTAYVWKRRERKPCNVLGSDSDNSFHDNDSESNNSRIILNKRKVSTNHESKSFEDDEDDDFTSVAAVAYRQSKPVAKTIIKKPSKRKLKESEFIDKEADVSCDGVVVSSDESDREDGYVNDSFVDDCTELSQDPNVDIKAMYLKSIVSPVKKENGRHLPQLHCLSDTDEHSDEVNESEDSFVVGNDVIEYNTEYMGDSMLAEDSIMLEAMQDNLESNKTRKPEKTRKNKRKRILMNDSSSDEDETGEKKKLKASELVCEKKNNIVNTGEKKKLKASELVCEKKNDIVNNVKSQATENMKVSMQIKSLQVNHTPDPKIVNGEVANSSKLSDVEKSSSDRFSGKSSDLSRPPINKLSTIPNGRNDESKPNLSLSNNSSRKSRNMICGSSEEFELHTQIPNNKYVVPNSMLSSKSVPDETLSGRNTPWTSNSLLSRSPMSSSLGLRSSVGAGASISSGEENVKFNQVPGLVLVDSREVNGGGQIVSRLKLHHGLNTAVVQIECGQYAVSTRMIVSRLHLSVFSSSENRNRLKKSVQMMLSLFERSVIIVELDKSKHGGSPYNSTHVRSKYIDTITCACAQVNQLRVLYSKGQDETAQLIGELVELEKRKGYNIPILPAQIQKWQQVINFYRSLPQIHFVTALCLARNFSTINEFLNSTPEIIEKKGCMTAQKATEVHQLISRVFRADMLS